MSLSLWLLISHINKYVSFILLDLKGIPAKIGKDSVELVRGIYGKVF